MIVSAEDSAAVRELIAIIDASADNTLGRYNVTPLWDLRLDPNSRTKKRTHSQISAGAQWVAMIVV
jgi:hypothetical protein